MASEQNKQELRKKLAVLVAARFGGDYQDAFGHYADRNGKVGKNGVRSMLKDAGIGSILTRWAWVAGIMAELDLDGDGLISRSEFTTMFESQEGIVPQSGTG